MTPSRWTLILAPALLIAAACSDDAEPLLDGAGGGEAGANDAGGDGASFPTLKAGGDGDAKLGDTLTATQARAGKVADKAHLLSGIKVEGKVGDFKIYNSKVAFIIQGKRKGDGLAPDGGKLLDAARLGQTGAAGRSLLGEVILGALTFTIKPRTVGVVADGSDGSAALVRVVGELSPVPLLDSFIVGISKDVPAWIAIDYSLSPGAEALDIRVRYFNQRTTAEEINLTSLVLSAGDGVHYYAEQTGYKTTAVAASDYLAMVGDDVGYALAGASGQQLTPLIMQSGIWVITLGSVKLPASGEADRKLKLVLSGGGPENLRRAVDRALGRKAPAGSLTGKVLDSKGKAVPAARVHVTSADGKTYVTRATADATGAYSAALAPGKYQATAVADGHAPSKAAAVTVASAAVTQDLSLLGSATLSYAVTDDKGKALPAKLTLTAASFTPHPESFGEQAYLGGASRVVYSATGKGNAALPPGSYTITASRGLEYEVEQKSVTLTDGASQSAAFSLKRSVDTTGFLCGDFHIHARWSYDASDLYELKVAAMAAEGLEVPVCSEHDYIADFNPTIAKMGMQPWMQGLIGLEITTGEWGHHNTFPITATASAPNRGALYWFAKKPAEIFKEVAARWPNALLQVNHPRSNAFGYFHKVGYDPDKGTFKAKASWSPSFDTLEVFNEFGWDVRKDKSVKDWFSMLDRGLILTATGNSDSHAVYKHEVGYPRTCVKVGTDDPAKMSPATFVLAMRKQQAVVMGGAFISVDVAGKSLGELASVSGGKVTLSVKVQAPSWVDINKLMIYRGGKTGGDLVKTVTLDKSTRSPTNPAVRYEGKIDVAATKDTWLVAVATGTKKLSPVVHNKQPFGVTNPIFIDADGDGKYTAPHAF